MRRSWKTKNNEPPPHHPRIVRRPHLQLPRQPACGRILAMSKPIILTPEDAERFHSRVDCSAGPDQCWPWTSTRKTNGYGFFKVNGRRLMAHRVALHIHLNGQLGDQCALHRCDNPPCCNPAHLFPGTLKDNVHDMISKGRRVKLFGDDHPSRKHPENLPRGEQSNFAKLKTADIIDIRGRRSRGESSTSIARDYPCTPKNIDAVVARRSWCHIP